MGFRAERFTPEVLLSAPRQGAAVPNHDGTLAIFSVSTYSFETKETTKEVRILDVQTGNSTLFTNDKEAHDANWLGDGTNAIIWLQSGAKGITSIMIGNGDRPSEASYTADVILAPFTDLKLKTLSNGNIACAFVGLATPDGSLYNKETAEKSPSSALIYDKLFVRFWDKYMEPEKNTIWYSKLAKSEGKYSLAAPVHNVLKGTGFESPFYNPLGSGLDAYDISHTGIIFRAAEPGSNPVRVVPSKIWFVPLSTFIEEKAPEPKAIISAYTTGSTASLAFSPCGKRVAFLQEPKAESRAARVMLVPDVTKSLDAMDLFKSSTSEPWDLEPGSVSWSRNGKSLYLTAEACGRVNLFSLSLASGRKLTPKALTKDGSVSGFHNLGDTGNLLVSSSSLIDNSIYSIVSHSGMAERHIVSTGSRNGLKFGLSPNQVSEMYFEGGGDYCVQAWIVKPSFFNEKKKYPLAMLIHGGPGDAWRETWSTRWNPAVWAEQGYVVVTPNPTGSSGFGVEFDEGVYNEWGGRPYEDIVRCFEYIKENMPFVDTDRAIAAGGSYGGYLVNWIQGNPLGREFKALVCHDGVYSTQMLIAGDDITDNASFSGPIFPWSNAKNLEKYNPARPDLLKNWKTPMLVIHSDLDYRCIMSDGIAAFHTLQAQGTESRFLTFPDEGHWVLKPENSLVWHKTVFDWINKYTRISRDEAAIVACRYCRPTWTKDDSLDYRRHVDNHVDERPHGDYSGGPFNGAYLGNTTQGREPMEIGGRPVRRLGEAQNAAIERFLDQVEEGTQETGVRYAEV